MLPIYGHVHDVVIIESTILCQSCLYYQLNTSKHGCYVPVLLLQDALHKDFGKKIGDLLWNCCRGIDHSVVGSVQVKKSASHSILQL